MNVSELFSTGMRSVQLIQAPSVMSMGRGTGNRLISMLLHLVSVSGTGNGQFIVCLSN